MHENTYLGFAKALIICFLLNSITVMALRSSLYPDDWALGFNQNGAQLQEYSYAGFDNANNTNYVN